MEARASALGDKRASDDSSDEDEPIRSATTLPSASAGAAAAISAEDIKVRLFGQ